jgi:hypothetical protein
MLICARTNGRFISGESAEEQARDEVMLSLKEKYVPSLQ